MQTLNHFAREAEIRGDFNGTGIKQREATIPDDTEIIQNYDNVRIFMPEDPKLHLATGTVIRFPENGTLKIILHKNHEFVYVEPFYVEKLNKILCDKFEGTGEKVEKKKIEMLEEEVVIMHVEQMIKRKRKKEKADDEVQIIEN